MAAGKDENLVTPYPYDLLQPSDKKILGSKLNLGYIVKSKLREILLGQAVLRFFILFKFELNVRIIMIIDFRTLSPKYIFEMFNLYL